MGDRTPRSRRVLFGIGGAIFVLIGVILLWRGFTTPAGEAAIRVPRREDWTAGEAKVIGAVSCVLGFYIAVFLHRQRVDR